MMIRSIVLTFAVLAPTVVAAQSLEQRLQQLQRGQWLSYEVALQPGVKAPCCFDTRDDGYRGSACRLDQRDWSFGNRDDDPLPAAGSKLRVLLRRADGGFDRLRAIGTHCAVDPAGAVVVEAGSIDADESVALLRPKLTASERERGHVGAAVAHHAGRAADDALIHATAANFEEEVRRDAVFWLARARGDAGWRHVRSLLDRERDDDLLQHEVFAIGISPQPGADAELRNLASRHANEQVRAEAIFWLAQDEDPQTEAIIREALANDESEEVREKAVFALSQLPPERAVPALRALVEGQNATRDVRKEALFWLAQVDDDTVLPVFDALLDPPAR
jgi:HEAT repeat protein